MRLALAPGIPAGAESGVYALLALLADPAAFQTRLDELRGEAAHVEEQLQELDALRAGQAVREKALAANEEHGAKRQTALEADAAALAARQVEAGRREAALAQNEAALIARAAELDAQAARLDSREDAIAAREQELAAVTQAVEALKAEYDGKLAALRQAIG